MSSIPIDHLGRDDLIILLNRVAARLSTVPGNHHPMGTPHTPISYESRTYATSNDIYRPSAAANRGWRLRYEEEHDPWNAHLRCELRASISDTTAYASQTGLRTFSSSSWNQGLHDVLPTTTRLTDAMTYRYNQVAALDSEQMLPQPDINTESSMARARVESDFCDCSCTCNYCGSICCLRKRGHTVHLCLIHKIP